MTECVPDLVQYPDAPSISKKQQRIVCELTDKHRRSEKALNTATQVKINHTISNEAFPRTIIDQILISAIYEENHTQTTQQRSV